MLLSKFKAMLDCKFPINKRIISVNLKLGYIVDS